MKKGYTLIEMLVVISVFAIISIIASQTIILTLRNTQKAGSISKTRQNLDSAIGIMERQLHNARAITSCTANSITFTDPSYGPASFSCTVSSTPPSYIASGSGNLTLTSTTDVLITSCNFSCSSTTPPVVTISITAQDISGQNQVSATTAATLRTY